jgi:transcriptional regulator with XRE-family HTH domain
MTMQPPSGTLGERVGRALREMRREAGLSQESLAAELGLDQRTVRRLETGEQRIYVDQMLDAERACGRPAGSVLRACGLLAEPSSTLDAIAADMAITDSHREIIADLYRSAVERSAAERDKS